MDSIKKRFVYKLSTNIIGAIISMIAQIIIPRGLGPKAYGDFNFLTAFFTEVVVFLDMGTSTGFYTKLSQRPKEHEMVSFYMYFSGVIFLIIIAGVFFATITSSHNLLWPGQGVLYIYLAAVWGILTWFAGVLNKMVDAYGLTVPSEKARMLQKGLGLLLILLLYAVQQFHLTNFFYYHYLILFFLSMAFIYVMQKSGHPITHGWRLSYAQIKAYLKEYYEFSHPLFVYAIVGLVISIFDRWLLQFFSGSVQQGFYSLSYQIMALCILFTHAMAPLLMREFSIAYFNKNLKEMAELFDRYIPLLYSIAAFLSCFVAVQAEKVIYIFGGEKYREAVMAATIMALYPIPQSYGTLSGSLFYATGQTKVYRNIGIISMLMGLPLTYFLIAPPDKMGLNAGATGLAIKMVLISFIGVNMQLYYNVKFLKLSFRRYLAHQVLCAGLLIVVAFIVTAGVDSILGFHAGIILRFLIAGFFYTITVAFISLYWPKIFGLEKQEIRAIFEKITGRFI